MKCFLSTKYKSGFVEFDEIGMLVDGGVLFKSYEGKTIREIMEYFQSKCNKSEIRDSRNVPHLIKLEEENEYNGVKARD